MSDRITLDVAREVVETVVNRAAEIGARICATVVDSAGDVVMKSRMDGVSPVSCAISEDKAYTAGTLRMASGDLYALVQPGAPLFGLTGAVGGRLIPFGGGLPLVSEDDGLVLGGVGVSGCKTPDADVALAEVGVRAAEAALKRGGG
jgi:uncharacterized protein GlcG (DUF336 family)